MTISVIKSVGITDLDTRPVVQRAGGKNGNADHVYTDTVEVPTTSLDEVGDRIKLIRVPSKLRLNSITLYNDDLDSGSAAIAVNVGVSRSDTGAVVLATAFSTGITTLGAANTAGVNVLFGTQDIANIGKTVWEMAGLTADPGVDLDIELAVTIVAATAAAGTISVVVKGSQE